MSNREALSIVDTLKLALEVLKNTQDYKKGCAFVVEAAEDIAEVLLNSEQCKYGQEPHSCTSNPMDCQCAIDAALAQPEQRSANEHLEPVAWLDEEKKIIYWHNTHETDDYQGFKRTTPLYTTPPQRDSSATPCTWVGLTDDEIDIINYTSAHMLAREVEAKLKEKNT